MTQAVTLEPAQAAPASHETLSVDSPLGEIFDTPAALAALQRYIPEMRGDPAARQNIRMLSLRTIAGHIPSATPQTLSQLNVELRQIAAPAPDPSGPAGDPAYQARTLTLAGLPRGTGPAVSLFNGSNLTGWDVYLGPVERRGPSNTAVGLPVGLNIDTIPIFSVQTVDGAPTIRSDGRIWGTLTTRGDYGNYHLHLEYKWGEQRWPEGAPTQRNNGVLYHSYGDYGALDHTWMNSIELEMIPGMVAGVNPVGNDSRFSTNVGRDLTINTQTKRRFMPGGRGVAVGVDGFQFIQGASDPEHPIGQWNSIDLYVFGDRAIHVLNGVPVMAIHDVTGGVDHAPLTHGRIQLQSEGAETFFRNLTLQPIERLPNIRVAP